MGNGLAHLMLVIWPFVCVMVFRKMPLERALIWCILGGYLFLPPTTNFNLPLIPTMDKVSIPNLSVLLILFFVLREKVQLRPDSRIATVLVFGLILSGIPTVLTNTDPIIFRRLAGSEPIIFAVDRLPGQSFRDLGAVLMGQLLAIVPFLLARQYLSTDKGLREILLAFMIGGLIYSIPSLIEIRLSPQINVWVYGFFQHSFEQMIREGGFRPIVFLQHGLWLALFICTALMAAIALARVNPPVSPLKAWGIVAYLAVLLYLCKSLASLAYGVAMVPVLMFAPPRLQVLIAAGFALVAVGYPMLRNAGVVPLEAILTRAEAINPERAFSLRYRFYNEEALLERAAERPLFGWGGYGRNLIRHIETGEILTIPDGRWIIIFGTFGWIGYLCEFGLLALPLALMGIYIFRHRDTALSPWIAPLCLILGITLMDMLLNATLTPLTWMTAGAILGHAEKRMPWRSDEPRHAIRSAVMGGAAGSGGRRTVL